MWLPYNFGKFNLFNYQPFPNFFLKDTLVPKYALSTIWPPGQVPVIDTNFNWETTRETKWLYAAIASITKMKTASNLGLPVPVLLWQAKRYNCRLSSFASNASGSLRLLCDLCAKFNIFDPQNRPHLRSQGCSMCLQRVGLVDTTGMVRNQFLLFTTKK